jgi:uncharacterized Tic20 family protein
MKKLNQIQLDAIVDSHRKKLINGAITIQIISCIVLVISLTGMFKDPEHSIAYNIVFAFFSIVGFFGIVQYDKHKRDFK